MGNAPRAAHKTTSGFLVPCRIDDTNGAKDRLILFIKSSLLAEAWSVVISTRDGQLRQDSGGGGKLFIVIVIVISAVVLVSPPAQEGARLSIETFAAAIGHRHTPNQTEIWPGPSMLVAGCIGSRAVQTAVVEIIQS